MRAAAIRNGKPQITEKVFTEQVRKAALLTGWMYYHQFISIHSASVLSLPLRHSTMPDLYRSFKISLRHS